MLAMYFQTAKIERVLDWQPLARLPLETQGNQVVFASNGKDKYTVQKHEYNGAESTFLIKQSSSPDQTQTIQIKEKDLTVTVQEKGKCTVSIQLNRETGLTLTVKDDAAGVTQQSVYNKESITHTSKGKPGTSTIVQKPDSVTIECKEFTVKCETALVDAKKTVTQKAAQKIFLDAAVVNAKSKVNLG